MANYYNVTGYKHTGFDTMNRPFSRAVLEAEEVTATANRCQVKGMAVNRQAMQDITHIDLQGSVKDLRGEQINSANMIGSQELGGPYYNWEEVDYLRLVRTGYPGDEDFIDISGQELTPWEASAGGKKQLRIGYYFVTGLEPLARNVTRLYLLFDAWTSCGASDELIIDTGWKIRGHITDAEDASSYNMAQENISSIYPLEVISKADAAMAGDNTEKGIVGTSIALSQYTNEDSISAILASATNGQTLVFPQIKSLKATYFVDIATGIGTTKSNAMPNFAFFDTESVRSALTVLYSAGVLDIQSSYRVPAKYIGSSPSTGGAYSTLQNTNATVANGSSRDIGQYPRKADYMYGQEVLMSKTSGNSNIQKFSDLTDRSIQIWSVPTATGYPIARFKGIKNHAYDYDQIVQGLAWQNNAIVLQGSSGSLFNQTAAYQGQAKNALSYAQNTQNYVNNMKQQGWGIATDLIDAAIGVATTAYGIRAIDYSKAGADVKAKGMYASGMGSLGNSMMSMGSRGAQIDAAEKNQSFVDMAYKQVQQQSITSAVKASLDSPYANFLPEYNMNFGADNDFIVYVVNTGAKDRARLKTYFKRFGYSGLYEKLTMANINVKQKVNFIQAEGVALRHTYYAKRDLYDIQTMLANGVFLWNTTVSMEAFDDNPDN